jgi:radical SAM superfamily enzyme YgiQ (UPF0313 family)
VKKVLPQTHVVWGGAHVGIYPAESLELDNVDSIIIGDGEQPFTELCQRIESHNSLTGVEGLYTGTMPLETKFINAVNQSLDKLPLMDLTMLPYDRYTAYLTGKRMATLLTSRGCPFRCIFCRVDKNKIRLMNIDRVIEQIKQYVALGVQEIEFYDETFNITTDRVKEFATKIIDQKIKIHWSFRGRIDRVDREMLRLIKAAGCKRIQYGVEAGSDRVLKRLRKGTTGEAIRKCFQLTNEIGIDTVAYLIIGSPGETLADIEQTINLIKEIKPTYVEYAIFNLSPGTEAYRMALEQKIISHDIWREYARNPGREMPVLTWTDNFSSEELELIRKKALRSFYANPRYIASRIINLKPAEALTTFRTGYAMLKKLLLPQQGRI